MVKITEKVSFLLGLTFQWMENTIINHTHKCKIAAMKAFQGWGQVPKKAHGNPFSCTWVRGQGFPEKVAMSWDTKDQSILTNLYHV